MAMTKCKECGTDLSTKAEACPKCGAKVPKTSLAAKGCLSLILLFVGLAVIGSLFGAKNQSTSSTADAPNGVLVELSALLSQYKDNEVRADAQFKGHIIETTGKVDDVKKDILGSIFVTVGTGRDFEIPQVQCFFDDSMAGAVSQLTKGATVTVQGRVDGLMMNVLVKDCRILSR